MKNINKTKAKRYANISKDVAQRYANKIAHQFAKREKDLIGILMISYAIAIAIGVFGGIYFDSLNKRIEKLEAQRIEANK